MFNGFCCVFFLFLFLDEFHLDVVGLVHQESCGGWTFHRAPLSES